MFLRRTNRNNENAFKCILNKLGIIRPCCLSFLQPAVNGLPSSSLFFVSSVLQVKQAVFSSRRNLKNLKRYWFIYLTCNINYFTIISCCCPLRAWFFFCIRFSGTAECFSKLNRLQYFAWCKFSFPIDVWVALLGIMKAKFVALLIGRWINKTLLL